MGKKTLTVLECDYPGCDTDDRTDAIERCQLAVGEHGVKRPLLCSEHRGFPFEELYAKLPELNGRRGRKRGVQVVDPKDIPRTGAK